MTKGYRHGENLLLPVSEFVGEPAQHTSYIVGHSETGHHHVLESTQAFDVAISDHELYLRLFEPAKLVHKKATNKHHTLTITPGVYKVLRKQEYDPWQQLMREVFD